jgi:hypothetical protein
MAPIMCKSFLREEHRSLAHCYSAGAATLAESVSAAPIERLVLKINRPNLINEVA